MTFRKEMKDLVDSFQVGKDIVACSNCKTEFDYLKQPEVCMGAVECPGCKCRVDQEGHAFKEEKK